MINNDNCFSNYLFSMFVCAFLSFVIFVSELAVRLRLRFLFDLRKPFA